MQRQSISSLLTVLVQSEGHPRILERLLAVVSSRAYVLTDIRSFALSGEPGRWLALTMSGFPERGHTLFERMASLPHVTAISRVDRVDAVSPLAPSVRVEQTPSGFRASIGGKSAEASAPEVAVARLLTDGSTTALSVLTDQTPDGVRVIGCIRGDGGIRAAESTGPDVLAATVAVFDALTTSAGDPSIASTEERRAGVL